MLYTRFIGASGDLAPLAHLSLPLLEKEKSILRVKVHSSVIMERFDGTSYCSLKKDWLY
jgi:histidine ammonia-lyase